MNAEPSWPGDGRPRFVATTAAVSNGRHEGYVLDRAYCHRRVEIVTARTEDDARRKAEAAAAELNYEARLTGCDER